MLGSLKIQLKKIWNKIFKNQSKFTICTNVLLLLLALQPVFSTACYVYWHHAPEMPESMKMNIELED